ncbi:sortase family protein [Methanobrevibacter cuticularis]|uniref:Sortase family protein n=1 Tax=Methanobrevibacter cuticularis TaxID=47311 RepID=A0A166CPJ1_9EURY|nr:class E sortase [Methanobrevibacter cuticularis]KZX14732.1 sortase family protein [Methanobrevibacter cuticularis]
MKIATIVLIISLLVVGAYASLEVSYYSSKIAIEKDLSSPRVLIPAIGINERINNVSINQGVYHEEVSYLPTKGDVILFGHRTGYGFPFLRLNELKIGDNVTLEWPGIGQVNYTITNSSIVPASYLLPVENNTQRLYLITCDPPGFTTNRLIYEANMTNVGELNSTILKDNPQENYGLYISLLFLGLGLILSYFYPIKEDRLIVLIVVIAISAFLFYNYFYPLPPEIISDKLNWLNGDFS